MTRTSRNRSSRTTSDDNDLRPVTIPDRPIGLRVFAARPKWRVVLRIAAVHRTDGRRHRDHPFHAYRRDQSRAGDHVHPDRSASGRPAMYRRLVRIRAGEHEPGSPDLCGDERGEEPSQIRRAGHLHEVVERRIPVTGIRRRGAPHGCGPGALRKGSGRRTESRPARNA